MRTLVKIRQRVVDDAAVAVDVGDKVLRHIVVVFCSIDDDGHLVSDAGIGEVDSHIVGERGYDHRRLVDLVAGFKRLLIEHEHVDNRRFAVGVGDFFESGHKEFSVASDGLMLSVVACGVHIESRGAEVVGNLCRHGERHLEASVGDDVPSGEEHFALLFESDGHTIVAVAFRGDGMFGVVKCG